MLDIFIKSLKIEHYSNFYRDLLMKHKKNLIKERKNSLVLLVFSDETNIFWLKSLKRGFRHCRIFYQQGNYITSIDPLSNSLQINVLNDITFIDIIEEEKRKKRTCLLVSIPQHPPKTPSPLLPLTCVEIAKRLLYIQSIRILTPWKLYSYLKEQNIKKHIDNHYKENIYRTNRVNSSFFKLLNRTKGEYIMGGLFGGAPTPPPEVEEDEVNPEEDARQNRLEMIRRRRRGRAGTIHTGWAGDKVETPDALAAATAASDNETGELPSQLSPNPSTTPELKTSLGG